MKLLLETNHAQIIFKHRHLPKWLTVALNPILRR
jgi:hypothetical protein